MKKHKKYDIFEFPTHLGLKAQGSTQPGVRRLPEWLKDFGLHAHFAPSRIVSLAPPPYRMVLDEESGVLNCESVASYAVAQAGVLLDHWDVDSTKIIVGGDCSILIGTALALKQKGRYGLFFLDGHTDFIPPVLSQTKAAAGMDLAIVTGNGHPKLTNLWNAQPFVCENHVFCVGNRNTSQAYLETILASQIHCYGLDRLRQEGGESVVDSFVTLIEEQRLDGFLIHIDVDVLDDAIMPAVDSRQAGGLSYQEFRLLLRPLADHPKFTGVEIAILDPDLDGEGRYTRGFVEKFIQVFAG